MFKHLLQDSGKIKSVFVVLSITVVSLMLNISTTFADTFTLDGSVDADDSFGTIASFTGSQCSGSIEARYDILVFHVDTTATYTLDVELGTLCDSVMMLYSPSFDKLNPLKNCVFVDDDGGAGLASRITTTLTADTSYIVLVRGFSGALGSYKLKISGPGNVISGIASSDFPLPAFTDGRINDYDVAAPIALYPYTENDATGLVIYDTQGVQLLAVSAQQIADAPENPDSNILIAEANGVSLYRIEGGLWQINSPQYNGKTYVMIFPELFHSGGYESFEIEG